MSGQTYTKLVQRDSDLKLEVSDFLRHSPLKVIFRHVKGHQDDEEDFVYEDAPQEVRRNIDMDKKAKEFLTSPPTSLIPNRHPGMFFSQTLGLFLEGTLITGNIRNQISLHHYGDKVEKRIQQSLRITDSEMQIIEWEGVEIAYRNLPKNEKISRMKVIHKYLPRRSLLYSRDESVSNACIRCNNTPETFRHVFQCPCRQNSSNHRQSLARLRQNLRKAKTHILVINAIAKLVSDFHHDRNSPYSQPLLGDIAKIRAISQVYDQQRRIGKDALIRGFIVINWMLVQNMCAGKEKLEHKDLGWMKKVIRSLWTYSYKMWVGRCKQVHESKKGDTDNMNHQELLYCIRQSLKIPREELSISEKNCISIYRVG